MSNNRSWFRKLTEKPVEASDDPQAEIERLRQIVAGFEVTCQSQQEELKSLAVKLKLADDFLTVVGRLADMDPKEAAERLSRGL